jgi:hypothetical protein
VQECGFWLGFKDRPPTKHGESSSQKRERQREERRLDNGAVCGNQLTEGQSFKGNKDRERKGEVNRREKRSERKRVERIKNTKERERENWWMCVLRSSEVVVDSLPYLLLELRWRRLVRRSENEAAISSIPFRMDFVCVCLYIYTHDGGARIDDAIIVHCRRTYQLANQ